MICSSHGHEVRALDNLAPQVHGSDAVRPAYLDAQVELVRGDVRDAAVVRRALDGVDAVFHLAAAVGVGQSMYEIEQYTSTNNLGTAVLLQALIERPVERLVVASSMSLYGEGLYRSPDGVLKAGAERALDQLRTADWELHDESGAALVPVPTPETKAPSLSSVYALSKFDQERLCLMIGRAYNIPTVPARFSAPWPRVERRPARRSTGLRASARQLASVRGLATALVTSTVVVALVVPFLLVVGAAWVHLRTYLLEGVDDVHLGAALVLLVASWILGLGMLGAGLAWRAVAWTAEVEAPKGPIERPLAAPAPASASEGAPG